MTTNDYAFDQSRRKVFLVKFARQPLPSMASRARWMSDKPWKTATLETSSVQVLKMRTGQASGLRPALVVSCICCCCCWRSMQALMGRVFGCHCRILMYLEIRCWCCCGLHSYSYHVSHWVGPRGLDCAHCSWFLRRLHLNVPRQHNSIWNIYTKAFSLRFALI